MFGKMICGVTLTLAMIGSVSAQTVLRFAEGTPNRGTRAEAVEYFMKDAKKLSGGELGFEMHWGGALLDYQTVADGVSNGSVDLGTVLRKLRLEAEQLEIVGFEVHRTISSINKKPPRGRLASPGRKRASNPERFPATASVALFRIDEFETFVQTLAHEVELRTVDIGHALWIDQHLDAVVLEDHVFRIRLVHILDLIGKARAARGLYAQPHTDALAASAQVARHMACRGFGHRDSHLQCTRLFL